MSMRRCRAHRRRPCRLGTAAYPIQSSRMREEIYMTMLARERALTASRKLGSAAISDERWLDIIGSRLRIGRRQARRARKHCAEVPGRQNARRQKGAPAARARFHYRLDSAFRVATLLLRSQTTAVCQNERCMRRAEAFPALMGMSDIARRRVVYSFCRFKIGFSRGMHFEIWLLEMRWTLRRCLTNTRFSSASRAIRT